MIKSLEIVAQNDLHKNIIALTIGETSLKNGATSMTNVLFSLPEEVVTALNQFVPTDQQDQFVAEALRKALEQQEQTLYECALAVEQDQELNDELEDWDVTR